jgi:cell division protein FtsI (penicillin-binding protein 3)
VIKDRRGNVVEDVESIRPPQEGKDIVLASTPRCSTWPTATSSRRWRKTAPRPAVWWCSTRAAARSWRWPTCRPTTRTTACKLVGAQLRNRALTDTFEPGSTLKPFTAALALEQGKVRFDTPIQTAPGKMTIGPATISDAHAHGTLTVAQVIQKSSNIGSAKLALSMKPEEMWTMFDGVGFGAPLKLGFPGEVGGRLRPAKTWKPIEQATMAYGHGISVTLIQLARDPIRPLPATATCCRSRCARGSPPATGKQVFSPQTAREVRAMLEMAVQPGGTAPKAQIPGYRVAGKTGTAHKLESGAYANKYVASFVGFAPAVRSAMADRRRDDRP